MQIIKSLNRLLLLAVVLPLIGCGGSDEPDEARSPMALPEHFGLYAIDEDGMFQRLDGDRNWEVETWDERSDLGSESEFVISNRLLAHSSEDLSAIIGLYRVASLRNIVSEGGNIRSAGQSRWVAAERREFEVPLQFGPMGGRMDAVRATPVYELEPGLYSLVLKGEASRVAARFGVEWGDVDHESYAQINCVDRIEGKGNDYRLCSEEPPGAGLRIDLAAPRGYATATGRVLAVEGTIVNVSDRTQTVPVISAIVEDQASQQLLRWTFPGPVESLEPGESVPFQELVENPPQGASRVRLSFIASQ